MAPGVCRLVARAAAAAATTSTYNPSTTTDITTATTGGNLPTSTSTGASLNDVIPQWKLSNVLSNMIDVSDNSWELGTAAEALLEFSYPSYSVFNESAFPPSTAVSISTTAADVYTIAYDVVSNMSSDAVTLMQDDAVGDPPSIGVAVLLANWTQQSYDTAAFGSAASKQLNYLLNDAPRSDAGAISHRAEQVQLWADSVFMVPPFLAYYGALAGGDREVELLNEAYTQISLYRDALLDYDSGSGLWKHIVLGTSVDSTHWATGNAWAAAGMTRVLMTMEHTAQADLFASHRSNLTDWIFEVLGSAWEYQTDNGAVRNTIDNEDSFEDASATALLAAVTYRMAVYSPYLIENADRALSYIADSVDSDGWLQNTVNPLTFNSPSAAGDHSPEGQAFVVLLAAAYRDWLAQNSSSTSVAAALKLKADFSIHLVDSKE
ncbi:hypothetical protein CYLTODRAFT_417495 [Cylindrobasidium torrendii FP15055 ss-10]|uniref:Glycoside hydrolase family 105 protein n=1 Tax=Cylindrobasidium torrendii FP15055 ss-10 TaxID=1314674 RepID=A0A0D7BR16_9AGAR|nr:hypothetical protein CYLTODRAFT_417495 [Cylindrobasidium torrendii FP15055 ss-10]